MTIESHEVLPRAIPVVPPRDLVAPVALTPRARRRAWIEQWHEGSSPLTVGFDAVSSALVARAAGCSVSASALIPIAFVTGMALGGAYGHRSAVAGRGAAWLRPAAAVGAAAAALVALAAGTSSPVAAAAALGAGFVGWLTRGVLWLAVAARRRAGVGLRPAVVVGPDATARRIADRVRLFPECGLLVAHVLDPGRPAERQLACRMVAAGLAEEIVVADGIDSDVLADLLVGAGEHRTYFTAALSTPAVIGARLRGRLGDLPLVPLGRTRPSRTEVTVKRAIDVVGAMLGLLLALPLLTVAGAFIKANDGGPLLYRQARVGRSGRLFTILKLRTMVPDADRYDVAALGTPSTDGLLFKLPVDPRVTPIGGVLRRLALDELPQLWNVLRGDMSLVGPRPLAVDPLAFESRARRRHAVRPGITGPWQVAGGNALKFAEMVDLDVAYAITWSIRRDLELLLHTVSAVAVRRAPY